MSTPTSEDSTSSRRILRDYGITIAVAALLALGIRALFVEAYRIPTSVMKPSLEAGDLIFVSKWPFLTQGRVPERGEVVVYRSTNPRDRNNYIKRVIAVPGDTIQISAGRVILNGKILDFEPRGNQVCGAEKHPDRDYRVCLEPPLIRSFGPERVGEGQVFVLADLRTEDSSRGPFGFVPVESILGRASFVWMSLDPARTYGLLPRIRFERLFHPVE